LCCLVGLGSLGDPCADQVTFLLGHLGDVAQRHDLAGDGLRLDARGVLADLLGVSNITPAGAALNSGLVGLAEWQTAQRSWITLCTLSKQDRRWTLAPVPQPGLGAAGAAASAGFAPPPNAVSGSGWYSIFAGALATSGRSASAPGR
jgi:hypothetical protein